jgi:putative DNA primase/helicase
MNKSDLPDQKRTSAGNLATSQNLTMPNLLAVLEAMGLEVKFNMMTAAPEYIGVGDDALSQDVARQLVLDSLTRLDINNHARYDEMINTLARRSAFHPMEEWMKSLKWDGRDRIAELVASVKTDNPLWSVYLENWLIQVVEGVCGWRSRKQKKSLPHVLTLVGRQGTGKSHWLESLGDQWFKGEAELHLSSPSSKDHQIEALKFPMVELAELDGIFRKSDISHMKSFISREEDSLRAPYERRAVVRPRMTAFCASVNDAEFLNDPTGSRRFWPVSVDSIDWSYEVDLEGLWAQAYDYWKEEPNFNLTAEQDRMREEVAKNMHTLVTAEAETLQEFYRRHHGNKSFPDVPMNRTEILQMLYGNQQFSNKTVSDIGKVLIDLVGKHKTIDGKQRAWWFPYNEFAADQSTWPDKYHLEIVK